jgi:hypothetical protein
VPAREDGHPALRRLVARDVSSFAERHWGRKPLLSHAADLPGSFGDLFSAAAVDELVSTRGLRTPFLRLAKNGTTLPERGFTSGGGVGAGIADQVSDDALLAHFADGATMVLQGLHRVWPPLVGFAQQLAADLGHPTQVNAYVTPPQSTGFSDHYDVHDVFVLQISGEKRWRIRQPVHPLPLRHEPWTAHRAVVEQAAAHSRPLVEATLGPGDCLYLPRGFLHSATACGQVSIHLTIGVHPWTRRHLADQLVREALDRASEDPAIRTSLPLGADLADATARAGDLEVVRAALLRAIGDVEPEDLAPALAAAARKAQRAAPIGPLAQAAAAEALKPHDSVKVRVHLAASMSKKADGSTVLTSRAGELPLDAAEVPAVTTLLGRGTTTVAELGGDLVRRLMLSGVIVPG